MAVFFLKNKRISRSWKIILKIILILIIAFAVYLYSLNQRVQEQFEGKRWQVPSRVYARPLELYSGKEFTRDQLIDELKLLRYKKYKRVKRGTYYLKRKSVFIHTRPFKFWDENQPAIFLEVKFQDNRIQSIWNVDNGEEIDLWRLEPLFIGGIYPKKQEDRILVRLQDVPDSLIETLLAVEDRDFYRHYGIAPLSILRALVANIRAGARVQGGSTLTQQLVKNFFLSNEKTITRKLNEAFMSLLLEFHYEKDEILEAYLNEIYLGQDGRRAIHGFGLASQFYFDAPLKTLNQGQVALLVGLVKGASYYDPRRFEKRARQRRHVVLKVQERLGLTSLENVMKFDQSSLGVTKNKPSGLTRYPAFVDLVKRQLKEDYRPEDLSGDGLRLFTTIDPWQQSKLEKVIKYRLPKLEKKSRLKNKPLQIAALITDTGTGSVRAMVGGKDFRSQGFNRVLDAKRHVGSLIKPAIYLTALRNPEKYNLVSLLDDSPISVPLDNGGSWTPQNYDKKNHGDISLIGALAKSYNVASVRLGMSLGLENIGQTLKDLGLKRDINLYPSMLLGASSMTLLEVLQMYQTLSEQGIQTPIRAIHTVTSANGKILSKYPIQVQQTIKPESVYLLLKALEEVANTGTARFAHAKLGSVFKLAGKTGTTNDYKDSWFAGITGNKVGVVWLGDDDNLSTGLTGSSGALRIWTDVIAELNMRSLDVPVPENISFARVDVVMHDKTGVVCQTDVVMPFISGYVPKQKSGVSCVVEEDEEEEAFDEE